MLLSVLLAQSPPEITSIYSTADLVHGLKEAPLAKPAPRPFTRPDIEIRLEDKRQEMIGFGGTFTENSAYNLKNLPPGPRQKALELFFHPQKGANWNLIRISMGSCDASSRYYSFAETPGDTELKSFSIQTDIDNNMIPSLKTALKLQPGLKIQASPWTAPKWMKDTGAHNHGRLLPQYYDAWARYFSLFIKGYASHGVPIWSITPQNEPDAFGQAWDAMGWKDEELGLFVNKHLAPIIRQQHPGMKIYGWDHNKNNLERWAKHNLEDPSRRKDYDGIVYHWYEGGEGKFYEPVAKMHSLYPELPLIANEQGLFGTFLMQPQAAELYATDIIGNVLNGCAGWIVWGTFFDHMGGPNHANNFSHSPIMVQMAKQKLIINPSYYYMAQFSKYVQRGARRVGSKDESGLMSAAFVNPDGQRVLVVLNKTGAKKDVKVNAEGFGFWAASPARSIATFTWAPQGRGR